MTTNDTQAPEQIWPQGGYSPGSYHCICKSCRLSFMGDKKAYQCPDCIITELVRRAAAQTAAAWIAGRDTCISFITGGCAICRSVGFTDFADRVMEIAEATKDLTPPDDSSAALEALIAERVREARENALQEAANHIRQYALTIMDHWTRDVLKLAADSLEAAARATEENPS